MASTLAEKILARAAGRERVSAGEIITARVDLAMANDFTAPLAIERFKEAGATKVFDPARICIVAGRHMPFRDQSLADKVGAVGVFCREQGIDRFFADTEGMDHALVPDLGYVLPGMLVCNADSHTCTYGAVGAFGVPMGSTDMAFILARGETWLRVPETIRVRYTGLPGRYVTSKDFVLATLGVLGVDGARYKSIEFYGEAITPLSVDERFTISNMAIEMGAKTGVMPVDDEVRSYLRARTDAEWVEDISDPDAVVERTVGIDVGASGPVIARPHSPSNVVPVTEVRGVRVNQVNIGTCTNGRIVDIQQALELLRGRKVAKGVRLVVTPATERIRRDAEKAGYLDELLAAGAVINPPGCGPCAGWHMGLLADGEVCVATHNRNFPGRMGSPTAEIYLASPYVAAAAAVSGEIITPEAVAS
ncbi:MAG: homoaconitate hydratase family protein [Alphaproteobacteria bacterium]|nr:homoaconitate hydratase family protein [Alphaproteobacteria bacterium]